VRNFGNGINAEAGVIIADWNKKPTLCQSIYPRSPPVSRMKQWSQAAFGQLAHRGLGEKCVPSTRSQIRHPVTG
jgi:hypothetical protein